MASFEQLDLLLGEALENMMGAAQEIRALDTQKTKEYLRHIGTATMELWAIREDVYSVRPDIKRDFVTESRSDPPRFEKLSELHQRAGVAEEREISFQLAPSIVNYGTVLRMAGLNYSRKQDSIEPQTKNEPSNTL